MNNSKLIIKGMFTIGGIIIAALMVLACRGTNTNDFIKTLIALVPSTFASVFAYAQSTKASAQVEHVHIMTTQNRALAIDNAAKVIDIKTQLDLTLKGK